MEQEGEVGEGSSSPGSCCALPCDSLHFGLCQIPSTVSFTFDQKFKVTLEPAQRALILSEKDGGSVFVLNHVNQDYARLVNIVRIAMPNSAAAADDGEVEVVCCDNANNAAAADDDDDDEDEVVCYDDATSAAPPNNAAADDEDEEVCYDDENSAALPNNDATDDDDEDIDENSTALPNNAAAAADDEEVVRYHVVASCLDHSQIMLSSRAESVAKWGDCTVHHPLKKFGLVPDYCTTETGQLPLEITILKSQM